MSQKDQINLVIPAGYKKHTLVLIKNIKCKKKCQSQMKRKN